jgi:hypothetical protein
VETILKKLVAVALLAAATSAHAVVIGVLIGYETFVTDKGVQAWKCTYNLNEHDAGAARRTIVSYVMCPAEMHFY